MKKILLSESAKALVLAFAILVVTTQHPQQHELVNRTR